MLRQVVIGIVLGLGELYAQGHAHSQRILTIQKSDGGSAVTDLGYNIAVNKGSSLHRRWFVINDGTCPIQLGTVGITARYSGDAYRFEAAGDARASTSITAYEIVFVQFDLWGNKMSALGLTAVQDISAEQSLSFKEDSWYANENDVREFFTTVAFVDSVMTADGTIWRADHRSITDKLQSVQIKIAESGLDPESPKHSKQ